MNNVIKLAIEKGGYRFEQQLSVKWNLDFLGAEDCPSHAEITQDPLFWQALGRALGWREGMYLKWYRDRQGGVDESLDLEYEESIAPDVYHALRYHELNLTGGDTDKFWKDLLPAVPKERLT